MRVAVVGGTGLVGRHVVRALRDAGHEPVTLARSQGVDVLTGRGLDAALAGVQSVVDVSNITTSRRAKAVEFFSRATQTLLAAERRAGVGHHVVLSIVGIDGIGWGYYEAKRRQEELALAGPVPASVLRATQFHEFADQMLARSRRGPLAFCPRMRVQPVGAREVGAALAALSAEPAVGRAPELAGPEQHELVDLARRLVRARHERLLLVPVRIPGANGKAMARGDMLPGPGARLGVQTFDEWLDSDGTRFTA
jgi:uncharacterized protein YbjT (DUF2867 family)